jgi:fructose-1,6-bisphosphatase II
VHLALTPEENLRRAAAALKRPVGALRIVVLDKPRHRDLIDRLHTAGARVTSPPDGDVAGALSALLPDGDADLLMGIGGTPEGVMTACAARALGGRMQARLAPQREDEVAALARAGLDTERIYELDDLVGGESLFAATGVTGGTLLRGPWRRDGQLCTESIVIAAGAVRRIVQAHPEEG